MKKSLCICIFFTFVLCQEGKSACGVVTATISPSNICLKDTIMLTFGGTYDSIQVFTKISGGVLIARLPAGTATYQFVDTTILSRSNIPYGSTAGYYTIKFFCGGVATTKHDTVIARWNNYTNSDVLDTPTSVCGGSVLVVNSVSNPSPIVAGDSISYLWYLYYGSGTDTVISSSPTLSFPTDSGIYGSGYAERIAFVSNNNHCGGVDAHTLSFQVPITINATPRPSSLRVGRDTVFVSSPQYGDNIDYKLVSRTGIAFHRDSLSTLAESSLIYYHVALGSYEIVATNTITGCTRDLGSVSVTQYALPVKLISFVAEYSANGNLLSWATASEQNNSGFEVEKSFDGENFKSIGWVAGAGTSSTQNSYEFLDDSKSSQTAYYRLKQVDVDGKFTYSEIISANEKGKGISETQNIFVFPNPCHSSFSVNESEYLSVTNVLGETIFAGNVLQNVPINVEKPSGIYFAHHQTGDVQKIILE